MHVLFSRFPYQSAYGGEEYHTLDIAIYLQSLGEKVSFFGSCPVLKTFFTQNRFGVHSVFGPVMPVTFGSLAIFFVMAPVIFWWFLLRFYLVHRSNAVTSCYCLSLTDKLLLTPIALFFGAKVVWVEHQYLGRWWQKSPLRHFYTALSIRVKIIPISSQNKRILLRTGTVKESIVSIVHGVEVPKSLEIMTRSETPLELIGYSGRIEFDKGLQIALRALKILEHSTTKVHLKIHGGGSYVSELQKLIHSLSLEDAVQLLPVLPRKQYKEFLQSLPIYVLPSLSFRETFGLGVAEAMMWGVIPIVTNRCGIAEYIENIEPRLVIKPNDPEQLANAIQFALKSEVSLTKKVQEYAINTFNKERMLQEYATLLLS